MSGRTSGRRRSGDVDLEAKLSHDFLSAVEFVEKSRAIDDESRLELHGLQKQAMFGDMDGVTFDGESEEEKARLQAWQSRSGMSKERCKELYVEKVQQLVPRFASKTLVKRAEANRGRVLERLESSASVGSPGKYKKKRSSVATLNPFTDEEEGESREHLRTRLRKFYSVHDKERLKRGLGDVLEWAIDNGEEALNRMLKEKYGQDLAEMEAQEEREERQSSPRTPLPAHRHPSRLQPEHSLETLASRRNIFEGLSEQSESVVESVQAPKKPVVTDETLEKARLEIVALMKEIDALGLNKKKRSDSKVATKKEAGRILEAGKTFQRLKKGGGLEKFEEILERDTEQKEELKEGIAEVINASEQLEESSKLGALEDDKETEEGEDGSKDGEEGEEDKDKEGTEELDDGETSRGANVGRLGTLILRGGTLVLKSKEKRKVYVADEGEDVETEEIVVLEEKEEEDEDGNGSELSDTEYQVEQVPGVLHVTPTIEHLLASDVTKEEFDAEVKNLTPEERKTIEIMYDTIRTVFSIEDEARFVRYASALNEDYLYTAFVNLYLSWLEDERFEVEFDEDGEVQEDNEEGEEKGEEEGVDGGEDDEKEGEEEEIEGHRDDTQKLSERKHLGSDVQSGSGYTQVRVKSPPKLPPRPKVDDPFPDNGKTVKKLPPIPKEEAGNSIYSTGSLNVFRTESVQRQRELQHQAEEEEQEEEEDVYTQRRFLKQLTEFLLFYEPDRVDKCLYVMVRFKNKSGLDVLNERLMKKYGANLETFKAEEDSAKQENERTSSKGKGIAPRKFLSKFPRMSGRKSSKKKKQDADDDADFEKLVELYYAKYDPGMIDSGELRRIIRWARKRGREELNKRLKNKYNESLDEFAQAVTELRDDLIEYYKVVDRTRLVNGIDQVLQWGSINGRQAVSINLQKKYGKPLKRAKKRGKKSNEEKGEEEEEGDLNVRF